MIKKSILYTPGVYMRVISIGMLHQRCYEMQNVNANQLINNKSMFNYKNLFSPSLIFVYIHIKKNSFWDEGGREF